MPEETKRKISLAKKGKKFSREHKEKISSALKGRKFTEETGKKTGKPKSLSEEQVQELIQRIKNGEKKPSVAAAFGVCRATVYNYLKTKKGKK